MTNFFKSKIFKILISLILIFAFIASLNSKFDFFNFNSNENSDSKILMNLKNIKITEKDLNEMVDRFKAEVMSQDQVNLLDLSIEEEEELRKNLLNGMINEKLFTKFSQNLKLDLNDELVIEQIKKTQKFNNDAGLFDQKKFQEFLKSISMSERGYIDNVKEHLLVYGLFNVFNKNQISIEFRNEIFLENLLRTKKIDLLELDFENFFSKTAQNIVIPSEKIQDFYEKNESFFVIPEYRSIEYFNIKLSDFKKNIKIDEVLLSKKIEEKLISKKMESSDLRSFDNIICESEIDAKAVIDFFSNLKFSEYKDKSLKDLSEIFKNEKKLSCLVLDLKEKSKENLPSNFSKIIFEELKLEDGLYFSKEILESPMGKHIFVLRQTREILSGDLKQTVLLDLENEISNQNYLDTIQKIRFEISEAKKTENQNQKFSELKTNFNFDKKNKRLFSLEGDYLFEEDRIEEIKNLKNANISDDLIFDKNLLQNIFSSSMDSLNLFQVNENEYIVYIVSEIRQKDKKCLEESSENIKNILIEKESSFDFEKKVFEIFENLKNQSKTFEQVKNENSWIKDVKNIHFFNPVLVKMNIKIQNPDYPSSLINEIFNNKNDKIIGPVMNGNKAFIVCEKEISFQKISEEEREKFLKAIEYTTYMNESNEILNSIIEFLKKK